METDSYARLVRPERNPLLDTFTVELTGITQSDIEQDGVPFPQALDEFVGFVGVAPANIVCNGLARIRHEGF